MKFKNLTKTKRELNIAIGGILFIAALMTVLLVIFGNRVNKEIDDISLSYIEDMTKEIDENLESELIKSLNYVKGMATSLENMDNLFSDFSLEYIGKVCGFTKFEYLWIIDNEGIGKKIDGTKFYVEDRDYFKDAMAGKSGISDVIMSKLDEKEEVVVYSPIYKDGKVEGILAGTYRIEEYTSIVKRPIFKGEGFVEIFSRDGSFISKSKHKNSNLSRWNTIGEAFKLAKFEEGFSYEHFLKDITEGKNGIVKYKIDNSERIAYYRPMAISDWYTFVVIPTDIIKEYTGSINNDMRFLMIFILFSFVVLIIILSIHEVKVRKELIDMNNELKISKERFIIAIKITGSLVIEYDIENKTIFHFNEGGKKYNIEKGTEVALEELLNIGIFDRKYIKEVEEVFHRIIAGDKASVGVVKLNKNDGESSWIKISLVTIYDSNGQPIKGIGTVEDITDSKEIELLYLQEEQNRLAIMSDSIETYFFDVTKNKFLYGIKGGDKFNIKDKSYESILEGVVKESVYKEDVQLVLNELRIENLNEKFEKGKLKIVFEYRKGSIKEGINWVEGTINLFLDSESGDLLGYLYVKDINERKLEEMSIRYEAERDQLTGIYNRRMTEKSIINILEDNNETRVHALLSIDLDGFKSVNDNHGHMVGDELLVEVAKGLTDQLRKTDIVGRMGGDEFIILLKDVQDKKYIELKAQEICNALKNLNIIKTKNLTVSGSIGIAISPNDGVIFSELYEKADKALYAAKHAGKDKYIIYNDSIE